MNKGLCRYISLLYDVTELYRMLRFYHKSNSYNSDVIYEQFSAKLSTNYQQNRQDLIPNRYLWASSPSSLNYEPNGLRISEHFQSPHPKSWMEITNFQLNLRPFTLHISASCVSKSFWKYHFFELPSRNFRSDPSYARAAERSETSDGETWTPSRPHMTQIAFARWNSPESGAFSMTSYRALFTSQ